jgi:hypothetical protein
MRPQVRFSLAACCRCRSGAAAMLVIGDVNAWHRLINVAAPSSRSCWWLYRSTADRIDEATQNKPGKMRS